MSVGIPKVDALASPGPGHPAFDRNCLLLKPPLPGVQVIPPYGQSEMQIPISIVRRDGTSRRGQRVGRSALPEKQQHLTSADVERAEAFVLVKNSESEELSIKRPGALEITHVEGSLEHPPDLRLHQPFSTIRCNRC